jgi:hypothetical protein
VTYPDPCALFGISAENYGVEAQDIQFLGMLIEAHPKWRNIIEFGTYTGLTALFMGLMLQDRNGILMTIDQGDSRPETVRKAWLPNMMTHTMDILEKPHNPGIESMILSMSPCLVVMDNGNKIQEVNSYAPIIPVGSAFCVHDFGTTSQGPQPNGEVCLADIRETLDTYHYMPVMHEEAQSVSTLFRCWVRE